MNYRACIQASIDYIENHLKEDLAAEALARIKEYRASYSRNLEVYP